MSSGVEATSGDPRATSRLRVSQLTPLINMTRDAVVAARAASAASEAAAAGDESTANEAPAAAVPEDAPRTSADATTEPRRRRLALPLTVGVVVVAGAAFVVHAQLRPSPTAPVEVAPALTTTAAAPATAPRPSELAAMAAEAQARESLERLRTGLEGCIRNGIHALPGGSPAVPSSLDALKDSAYTPAPGDWKTAVWSCAQFQISDPMQFQVQWQLVKPNAEGMGIAWIDQDHDGVADRALGFSITLGPKGAPRVGKIAPIPATTPRR
jgi:hypothetical protein